MPADLELFLSASPALFTNSTITDCRYSNYAIHNRNFVNHQPFVYHAVTSYFQPHKKEANESWEKKSLPDDTTVDSEHHKTEKKKRVSFADDKGLNLVDVRMITEAPETYPAWTDDFLSMVTYGVKPQVTSEKKWKPTFDYPPYDSKILEGKLEKDFVALEKAALQDDNEDLLKGSIKVRNISFEKEVFVRATFDRWVSYEDIPATFVKETEEPSEIEASGGIDTFEFSVEIPSSASRYEVVEFCLCFKCRGKEHWDNNGGINYRLVSSSKSNRTCAFTPNPTNGRRHSNIEPPVWARVAYPW